MTSEIEERVFQALLDSLCRPWDERDDQVEDNIARVICENLKSSGYVIVPIEPTAEMKKIGARSIGKTMGEANHTVRSDKCYRAMVEEFYQSIDNKT